MATFESKSSQKILVHGRTVERSNVPHAMAFSSSSLNEHNFVFICDRSMLRVNG